MKRYICFVLALVVFVAVIGAACDGGEPSEPEATATPTTAAVTPLASTTATVAPAPTTAEAITATPTAMAATTPTTAAETITAITPGTPADTPTAMAQATAETPTGYTPTEDRQAAIYEALLATIPDTPETRHEVYIDDYALVRQIFDPATFPLPGPEDKEDTVAAFHDWLPPLSADELGIITPALSFGGGFFGVFNPYRSNMVGNFQHLAFDVRNIDQNIRAGPPSQVYDVVRGGFDPKAADAALSACSECPAPSIEEHGGIFYYSWGEDDAPDRQLRFAPPVFDHLGRGGRIAVLDEYLFRTLGTSEMKGVIDAHLKEVPSLADVEEFRLLASGMSRLMTYTMFLSDGVERWGIPNYAKASLQWQDASQADIEAKERELAESGFWLRSYQVFGVGAGKDGEGRYMALVLVHADGDSAEENVGRLHRIITEGRTTLYDTPWSDDIDISSLEINAEGRLLLAKIRGRIAASPLDWVFQVDSLILHE